MSVDIHYQSKVDFGVLGKCAHLVKLAEDSATSEP
jgi:hypothetical protein